MQNSAEWLKDRFGIVVPKEVDRETLMYEPVAFTLSNLGAKAKLDSVSKILFTNPKQGVHQVRLVAFVICEYSHRGGDYAVKIKLFRGDTQLQGEVNLQDTECESDWMLPGTQFNADRIWFKTVDTKYTLVRRFFPDMKASDVRRGIAITSTDKGKTWGLPIAVAKDAYGVDKPICPLGAVVNIYVREGEKSYTLGQIPDGKGTIQPGFVISEEEGNALVSDVIASLHDPRPALLLTDLRVDASCTDNFILTCRGYVFYCPLTKNG